MKIGQGGRSKVRVMVLLAGGLVMATSAGCGGSAPPAQGPAQAEGAPPAADSAATGGSGAAPDAPGSPDVMAGIRSFDAGDYAEARKAFDAAAKKNPTDYEAQYNLGMTCEKLGDLPAAEAAYKAALAAKPGLDSAAAALSSLYVDAGRIDDALAVAKNGLAKHPGSAPLHENLAVALASRGDQDNATKEFSAALQITPNEAMYHFTFAHWLNVWKVRGAAPHLDAARDLVKDDYAMIASIGFEYRMAGEFDSCVKMYDRAIAMKDGGEVRTQRALCRLGMKDDKGTLTDLQAAVAKEPTYAQAHYYLAGRLAKDGHFKEAAAEYAKYLELEPNGSLAAAAADKLKHAQEEAKKGTKAPAKAAAK
jgi:tetratricopeptide (TPR) repeat protein